MSTAVKNSGVPSYGQTGWAGKHRCTALESSSASKYRPFEFNEHIDQISLDKKEPLVDTTCQASGWSTLLNYLEGERIKQENQRIKEWEQKFDLDQKKKEEELIKKFYSDQSTNQNQDESQIDNTSERNMDNKN